MDDVLELLQLWHFGAVGAFFLVLVLDFGMIMALRWVVERRHYWAQWRSFWIGDTLGLPIAAGAGVKALSSYHAGHAFFDQLWFADAMLALGLAISLLNETNAVQSGFRSWQVERVPSQIWHTFIFGVVFAWMVVLALPVLFAANSWWKALAIAGYAIWISAFLYDTFRLKAHPELEPSDRW